MKEYKNNRIYLYSMSEIYSNLDINAILFEGFSYKLPDPIAKTINDLEKIFGSTIGGSTVSEQNMKSKSYERKQPSVRTTPVDNDWTGIRTSFKTTKLDVKEGIEKDINIIRSSLNKISTKNYDSQRNIIIDFISNFIDTKQLDQPIDEHNENIKKIGYSIFDIASTNKTNSSQYAELYRDLIAKFDIFGLILTEFIGNFKNTISTIHYTDPAVNYDLFCSYTKSNDTRKSTTEFLVNLMKLDVVSKNTIIDIIQYFQKTVIQYISESGRIHEVEEIIENIYIFVSTGLVQLKTDESWSTIVENITTLSEMQPKKKPSMTSRAVFKCMDTLDKINQ